MEYYYVKLVRMKIGVLTMEPADEEARLFSSMCLAEKWLTDNGFIYGQRRFFNYTSGGKEWFHKDDMSMEYVDVVITELNLEIKQNRNLKNLGRYTENGCQSF